MDEMSIAGIGDVKESIIEQKVVETPKIKKVKEVVKKGKKKKR